MVVYQVRGVPNEKAERAGAQRQGTKPLLELSECRAKRRRAARVRMEHLQAACRGLDGARKLAAGDTRWAAEKLQGDKLPEV